jgi:hypothetical protein
MSILGKVTVLSIGLPVIMGVVVVGVVVVGVGVGEMASGGLASTERG